MHLLHEGRHTCDGKFIKTIKFTHDTVHFKFSRGLHTLIDTFTDLFYDKLDPDDLPPIEVMVREGDYWVVNGNRRLLLYKKLLEIKSEARIKFPVIILDFEEQLFNKKKTTNVDGRFVVIRHLGNEEFDKLIQKRCNRIGGN
eukprot:GHVR01013229.1.p1 GENE.GHVR01013229.1~~GHVR01013229.1.p1  ORF type:complete len:142 (+),score=15.61 GHVR01013229.1:212-637(+)